MRLSGLSPRVTAAKRGFTAVIVGAETLRVYWGDAQGGDRSYDEDRGPAPFHRLPPRGCAHRIFLFVFVKRVFS